MNTEDVDGGLYDHWGKIHPDYCNGETKVKYLQASAQIARDYFQWKSRIVFWRQVDFGIFPHFSTLFDVEVEEKKNDIAPLPRAVEDNLVVQVPLKGFIKRSNIYLFQFLPIPSNSNFQFLHKNSFFQFLRPLSGSILSPFRGGNRELQVTLWFLSSFRQDTTRPPASWPCSHRWACTCCSLPCHWWDRCTSKSVQPILLNGLRSYFRWGKVLTRVESGRSCWMLTGSQVSCANWPLIVVYTVEVESHQRTLIARLHKIAPCSAHAPPYYHLDTWCGSNNLSPIVTYPSTLGVTKAEHVCSY